MLRKLADRATGTERMPPIGAQYELPPYRIALQIEGFRGRYERDRARRGERRVHAQVLRRVRSHLGEGDVAGRFDEARELSVKDGRLVDREGAQVDLAH